MEAVAVAPYPLAFPLLALAAVAAVAYFRFSRRRLYELAEKLPGPNGIPLFGSAHEFLKSNKPISNQLWERSFEYPQDTPIKLWMGSSLLVFLQDPRDVEVILGSREHLHKSQDYRVFRPWLGRGLLLETGDHYHSHRKLIAPTFHLSVLKSYMDVFNRNSRTVVERLRGEAGRELDVHHHMSVAALEILLETAMGVRKEDQDVNAYLAAVVRLSEILSNRLVSVFLRFEAAYRLSGYHTEQGGLLSTIHGFTGSVIRQRKARMGDAPKPSLSDDLQVDEKRRLPFLDQLIESEAFPEQDVQEEVDTIMFEGHDTLAAATSFFLSLMGAHPDVQDRIVEELDAIFAGSDRPATFQDTLQMKYLEMCILETLRLYPPVPILARELKKEMTAASTGHTIPAGCRVVVATAKIHRNPNIYPNPNKFNPDNFLPERCVSRHYYSFLAFSAGPRSCVGRKFALLELKVLMSSILRQLSVRSSLSEKQYYVTADIILKRTEGFPVSFHPRNASHTRNQRGN